MPKEKDDDTLPLLASQANVVLSHNGVDVVADDEEFVSLNTIYSAFGSPKSKDPRFWLRLDSTKSLIASLAHKLDVRKSHIARTTKGGKGGGGSSSAHKTIAIAYAEYVCDQAHIHVIEGFRKWAEEEANPGLKADRAIEGYQKLGYSFEWVDKRLKGKVTHKRLTSTMKSLGAVRETYQQVAEIGNVKVIGRPAKAIKAERAPATRQTRDSFTESELVATAFYESQTDQTLASARAYGHDVIVSTALVVGNAVQKAIDEGLKHAQVLRNRVAQTPASA